MFSGFKKIYAKRLAVVLPVLFAGASFAAGCSGDISVQESTTTASAAGSVTETSVAQGTEVSATEKRTEASGGAATESTETAFAEKDFYVSKVTEDIFKRMDGYSYGDGCTIPVEDLRYIHVLHKDIDGVTHEGEMVCNKKIAADLIEIFEELYEASYPIEKMVLVDEFGADDELSMRANNSSSFNYRLISGTEDISVHGEGLAVDINPLYNPFVTVTEDGEDFVEPDTAWDYVDRDWDFPYKIEEDDLCVKLFKEHGFVWGGDWIEEQDYQHFEKDI